MTITACMQFLGSAAWETKGSFGKA